MTEFLFFRNTITNIYLFSFVFKDLESSSIKLILASFVHSFTGHGFNKLVITKNPILKASWTLFILLGTAGCMYYINMNIQEFFQYNVFTNIITKYSTNLTFPAITICPQTGKNLDIIHCQFELGHDHPCNFTNMTVYTQNFERLDCFTINGPDKHTGNVIHSNILFMTFL